MFKHGYTAVGGNIQVVVEAADNDVIFLQAKEHTIQIVILF